MVAGSREDVNQLGLSREADVVAAVERTGADLVDARLGPTILGSAISIRQRDPGEAKNTGIVAAAGAPAFPRDAHGIHDSCAVLEATIPFGAWAHYERRVAPGEAPLDLEDWLR